MGKTISSRNTSSDTKVQLLQDMMYILDDALEKPLDEMGLSEDESVLFDQLQTRVVELASSYIALQESSSVLANDLVSLSVANIGLAMELKAAAGVIVTLLNPVADEDLLDEAVRMFKDEGNAELDLVQDPEDPMIIDVKIRFGESEFREALRTTLEVYNNTAADKKLGN